VPDGGGYAENMGRWDYGVGKYGSKAAENVRKQPKLEKTLSF